MKKRNKYIIISSLVIIILVIILLLLRKCQPVTEEFTYDIPVKGAELKYVYNKIDPVKGEEITYESGSILKIPENAFVDKEGNPVTDSVTIMYREFRNILDIILSGIPMTCDSAGTTYNFQTAGMFEIQGTVNNEEIYIENGKSLELLYLPQIEVSGYDLYMMNDNNEWEYLDKPEIIKKDENIEGETTLDVPESDVDESFTAKLFDFNFDYEKYPELSKFYTFLWKYAGPKSEIENLKNLMQYGYKVDRLEVHNKNKNMYIVYLRDYSDDEFTMLVSPVPIDDDFDKIDMANKNKYGEEYAAQKEKSITTYKEKIKNTYVRMAIIGFSTTNLDRFYKMNNIEEIKAGFALGDELPEDYKDLTVYHITGNDRVSIRYPEFHNNNFVFSPDEKNTLLTFLTTGETAIFSDKDFQNIKEEDLEDKEFTFNFKKGTLDNKDSFLEHIGFRSF